jgi:pyridoxal phosphate enzyme (YggS family)
VTDLSKAERAAQLAEALDRVRDRVRAGCAAAGRDPAEVRLVAVTKTFPATDVALLTDLGVSEFGENRDQEAAPKIAELEALRPHAALRWHMVGRLQRNKARSVARWAAVVQSVDSMRLADALTKAVAAARKAGERGDPLEVLVQASLDPAEDRNPRRGGCPLPELPALADHVARSEQLRLRGVMAIAPLGVDPEPAFAQLAETAAALRHSHPDATDISAGMSADLESALAHGSTCVRVGTALLGDRPLASP